ncbi:hypothetical protein AB6A40_006795 [Gnathostoma spinigerum]|uniref:Uncharacterized protein n=1 Tax=Gnathostoma spinigerum TaxID=75299 RepID=A0ABD6ELE5_9BILA
MRTGKRFSHTKVMFMDALMKKSSSLTDVCGGFGCDENIIDISHVQDGVELLLWGVDLSQDGIHYHGSPRPLLNNGIPVSDEYIASMREDAPELIIMTAPGLTIWRINCLVQQPTNPTDSFSVANSDLSHFYDAFLSHGLIYFMSASPDGHLDYSRIHVLDLASRGTITTQQCFPDPQRGSPCARKEAAIASMSGFILLAGGEIDHGTAVTRLVDYWVLDLSAYKWIQIPAQMPVPLIEPRLTTCNSGNVYIWGDFDQPLPGMPSGTHLRILKVVGFHRLNPPPYNEALSQSSVSPHTEAQASAGYPLYPSVTGQQSEGYSNQPYPNYPSQGGVPPNQASPPYSSPAAPIGFQTYGAEQPTSGAVPGYNQQPYPQMPQSSTVPSYGQPPYPGVQTTAPPYATQQCYPPPPVQGSTGQYAYYPPTQKKDCSLQ